MCNQLGQSCDSNKGDTLKTKQFYMCNICEIFENTGEVSYWDELPLQCISNIFMPPVQTLSNQMDDICTSYAWTWIWVTLKTADTTVITNERQYGSAHVLVHALWHHATKACRWYQERIIRGENYFAAILASELGLQATYSSLFSILLNIDSSEQ